VPNSIHLTVATVVERDSTFLMVRETIDGEQVINQPAGHVEPGEDVMTAALRETMEETGWEVAITSFLGFSNAMSPTTGITYYRLVFIAEALNFNADAEIDNDIDSAEWMTLDEIKDPTNKPRSEMVHQAIDDFISGRVFSLEMFRNRL